MVDCVDVKAGTSFLVWETGNPIQYKKRWLSERVYMFSLDLPAQRPLCGVPQAAEARFGG
jgi:hypothetical protein